MGWQENGESAERADRPDPVAAVKGPNDLYFIIQQKIY